VENSGGRRLSKQIRGFIRDTVPDKFIPGDDEEIHGRRVTENRYDMELKQGSG